MTLFTSTYFRAKKSQGWEKLPGAPKAYQKETA